MTARIFKNYTPHQIVLNDGRNILVLAAAKAQGRTDCIAPATGHPKCIRKDGFIVSVPGFID